jgi:hypothetical protein
MHNPINFYIGVNKRYLPGSITAVCETLHKNKLLKLVSIYDNVLLNSCKNIILIREGVNSPMLCIA